jgi:hypothetical protein
MLASSHEGPAARFRAHGWRRRLWEAETRNWDVLRQIGEQPRHHLSQRTTYVLEDALQFLAMLPPSSLHAIVTDPP